MIRWRELLSSLQIAWVDHGRNVGRNEIAIRCPWCGAADPSQHLGISEQSGYYHCLRAPDHGGKSPRYLLYALGVRRDLDELIEAYGGAPSRQPEAPITPPDVFARRWDSFRPAAQSPDACDYLKQRGFWNPQRTAATFDLRVGVGRYGGRLWFPLRYGEGVAGYTGRALRGQQPRYFTEASTTYLYLPRLPYDSDRVLILVEGPIDALKLADATEGRYAVLTAALCGQSITPSKRVQLLALAGIVQHFFVVMDSTVQPVAANRLRLEIMACLSGTQAPGEKRDERVRRLDLPPGVDDPGELTGEQIEIWLRQSGMAELANAN